MADSNGFSELAAEMFNNSGDEKTLKQALTSKYTENDLIVYLQNEDPIVSRSSAAALGLIGKMDSVPALVENLKNDDLHSCFNTEIALWNIWSRSGDESVDKILNAGKRLLKNNNFTKAIDLFTEAIESAPEFAEGFNQRAIGYFLLEEWEKSLEDCIHTLELNPHHFAALAGMGHVYLRLGQIDMAVDAYKQALAINPNLVSIAETLMQLRRELQEE